MLRVVMFLKKKTVKIGFYLSQKQANSDDQKVYFHGLKEQHIIIPDEHDDNQQHNLHIVMDGQVEVR